MELQETVGVSRSNTEAECRQLACTLFSFFQLPCTSIASLSWFQNLFRDLHLSLDPPRLCYDNIRALDVASNPVYQARTRHVQVDYHYINVTRKKIVVDCVASTNQLVDLLTKGLSSSPFTNLVSKLPLRQRSLSL